LTVIVAVDPNPLRRVRFPIDTVPRFWKLTMEPPLKLTLPMRMPFPKEAADFVQDVAPVSVRDKA
jgi:hypothetical protein